MLTQPRLSGPVSRTLLCASRSEAATDQSFNMWHIPADGADQSTTPWV